MQTLTSLRGTSAVLLAAFTFGCLVALPSSVRGDPDKSKTGKKGPTIPIKVGAPIIKKDKKQPPKKS